MNPPFIRLAKDSDIDQIIDLCAKHAKYENVNYERNGKAYKLKNALFKINPSLFCFVAEKDGKIVGYSTVTKEFSTWDADYFLHMDCLYILENTRGMGLGSLFMDKLKKFCIENCCTHIQWQTPVDNLSAIQFYKHLGATSKDKKRFFYNETKT